jgi:transposase
MYAREHRVLLRHYLEQGLSKTAIACTLRVSRRTVYHWINTGQLDRELDDGPVQYTPRPPVPRKIDRYCGVIQARLSEYPRLSATRLYEEIRVGGYARHSSRYRRRARALAGNRAGHRDRFD